MKTFWDFVDKRRKDECWNWFGTKPRKDGYAIFSLNGKKTLVHRIAYTLTNGNIPNNLDVLHSCDNRLCCNPSHLRTGTDLDNQRDMITRGRRVDHPGELHGQAKTTWDDVRKMRAKYSRHLANLTSISALAKEFNLSKTEVHNILAGKAWKE